MTIVDVRALPVDGKWRNWVFVRVETADGLVGWGEASLEGREQAVVGAVADMSRKVVGADPQRVRAVRRAITRKGYWETGPVISSAVAGIEIALWDLVGKQLDVPVSTLLGGAVHERMPVYSNAWYFGATTDEDFSAAAAATVALGYRGLKFDPFGGLDFTADTEAIHRSIARVRAVRAAVGPDVDLLIEGHGRFGIQSALRIARHLVEFDIVFFEEPVTPGDVAALRHVAERSPVPIASGERCCSIEECRRHIEQGAVDVFQPDLVHLGGIQATLTVVDLCDAAAVHVAPHNASGPIATAATLHVSAVAPNLLRQEMFAPRDAPWKDALVGGLPVIKDGFVSAPSGPGLGITVDEDVLAAHPYVPRDLELLEPTSILDRPPD